MRFQSTDEKHNWNCLFQKVWIKGGKCYETKRTDEMMIIMRLNPVLVSKSVLQIILFSLFLAFFGVPSLLQYQREEIIVLKSELKQGEGIEPPAVTLEATRETLGWKTVDKEQFWKTFDLFNHCQALNKTVEDCIKEDSFALEDFLVEAKYIGVNGNYNPPITFNSSDPSLWKEELSLAGYGRHFTFKSLKNITQNEEDCLAFTFAKNFSYAVFVHDEDFFLYNVNPLGTSTKSWRFNGATEKNHFQEMTLTKHKKLNLERQPCEEDPDYIFSHCARESLSKKVNLVDNYEIVDKIVVFFSNRLGVNYLATRGVNKAGVFAIKATSSGCFRFSQPLTS